MNKHYFDRYNKLILYRRKNPLDDNDNVYKENHHIIPKCMGGNNDDGNLIYLTGREHFIAHYLLAKSYPEHGKLWYAFNLMSRICNGRSALYERTRKYISENISNDENRSEKISMSKTGKKFTQEHRANISKAKKGEKNPNWGKKRSTETVEKIKKNGNRNKRMYYNSVSKETIFLKENETIPEGFERTYDPSSKEKISKSMANLIWVHNPDTRKNMRISKDLPIPDGFIRGRIPLEKIECCGKMWDPGNYAQHRKKCHES